MSTIRPIIAALAFATFTAPALAAQPVMVDTIGHWGVYSYDSEGAKRCYVLTMPQVMQPASVNHGRNFLIVAPQASGGYMPQAQLGYDLKTGAAVTASIDGGETFEMIPRGNVAWLRQSERDSALVAAMKSGGKLTVEATSKRGTDTHYEFSLSGVTAALRQAEDCK